MLKENKVIIPQRTGYSSPLLWFSFDTFTLQVTILYVNRQCTYSPRSRTVPTRLPLPILVSCPRNPTPEVEDLLYNPKDQGCPDQLTCNAPDWLHSSYGQDSLLVRHKPNGRMDWSRESPWTSEYFLISL